MMIDDAVVPIARCARRGVAMADQCRVQVGIIGSKG
jgi:hypothetical protein